MLQALVPIGTKPDLPSVLGLTQFWPILTSFWVFLDRTKWPIPSSTGQIGRSSPIFKTLTVISKEKACIATTKRDIIRENSSL